MILTISVLFLVLSVKMILTNLSVILPDDTSNLDIHDNHDDNDDHDDLVDLDDFGVIINLVAGVFRRPT